MRGNALRRLLAAVGRPDALATALMICSLLLCWLFWFGGLEGWPRAAAGLGLGLAFGAWAGYASAVARAEGGENG